MKHIDENQFWEMVETVGWPNVDVDAAKLDLMLRYDSQTTATFRIVFNLKKAELTRAAAVDWCCDSWDDTRAHIVGLGRTEYERHLMNPATIRGRHQNGDFKESFAYCLPFPDDYELLCDSGYDTQLREVRQFLEMLNTADPDDVPPNLYRRFDQVRGVSQPLLGREWRAAVRAYHEAYGDGYADDWPFAGWCGYLIPNIVRDLEKYRLLASDAVDGQVRSGQSPD